MWYIRAFYRFIKIEDSEVLQKHLKAICEVLGLKGIILIAPEGINSTIAGSKEAMQDFWSQLTQDPRFQNIDYKESTASTPPFQRIRVRLKKEIVTLGVSGLDPSQRMGVLVEPEQWNTLIQDPEVILVDVRNTYETQIGTFRKARDPQTSTFREFPEFVQRHLGTRHDAKVAMYCTGGIRCEKASAYMMSQGFQNVFQLSGGILKYIETVAASETLWEGECFVFDRRVAVGHDLTPGEHTVCYGCRIPLSVEDRQSPHFKEGVHCASCYETRTAAQHRSAEERMRQIALKTSTTSPLCYDHHHV